MKLSKLLERFPEIRLESGKEALDQEVGFVRTDSRKTGPRDIFCIPNSLGEKSLAYAEGSEAGFLLFSSVHNPGSIRNKIILKSDSDPETLAGPIASFLLGDPSDRLKVIGVTGTNGKTSLTHILSFLGEKQGKSCGLIGTTGVKFGSKLVDTGYTTPDPSSLQEILKEMADSGIEYVFMEASSHGLKLGRTNGIRFRAGVFSNLTQDHLDFHPDMQDYLRSKGLLFRALQGGSGNFGVLDSEAPGGKEMSELIHSFGKDFPVFELGPDRIRIENPVFTLESTEYDIHLPESRGGVVKVRTNLLGGFNVRNTALAFVTGLGLGWEKENLLAALRHVPQIPGRFQIHYSPDRSRMAVVDYAHTPDALENILKSIRESRPKELIALFGCGGDRDKTKRPKMGKIAQDLADKVILTSDNPRTEEPESILDDIQRGFTNDYNPMYRDADRAEAIRYGISNLPAGGCLLVAGKGHEDYQIVGKEKRHFDDGEEIEKAFRLFYSG